MLDAPPPRGSAPFDKGCAGCIVVYSPFPGYTGGGGFTSTRRAPIRGDSILCGDGAILGGMSVGSLALSDGIPFIPGLDSRPDGIDMLDGNGVDDAALIIGGALTGSSLCPLPLSA